MCKDEQGLSDFSGFQRRVDRTDQLDKGIAAIQLILQRARPLGEASGEICLTAARGGWIRARCSRHRLEEADSR